MEPSGCYVKRIETDWNSLDELCIDTIDAAHGSNSKIVLLITDSRQTIFMTMSKNSFDQLNAEDLKVFTNLKRVARLRKETIDTSLSIIANLFKLFASFSRSDFATMVNCKLHGSINWMTEFWSIGSREN